MDGKPWAGVDVLGLVTLQQARNELESKGVPKKGEKVIGRGSYNIGEIRLQCYSDEQVFNKWLEMERRDMSWLNELNDRKCPATLLQARENPEMWGDPIKIDASKATAWYFHEGAAWDVRSKATKSGHTNQCTYDRVGQLIRYQRPAAGTADYKECKFPIFNCGEHTEHDVKPYQLAVRLHNKYYGKDYSYNNSSYISDYYSVRPTIY